MKYHYLVLTLLLLMPLATASGLSSNIQTDELTDQEYIADLEGNMTIPRSDDTKYQNGLNLFVLQEGIESGPPGARVDRHLAVTDMEGNYVIDELRSGLGRQPTMINETTMMYNRDGNPEFWNFVDNVTDASYNFTRNQHHDMQYDPQTDTFMVLESIVSPIKNQTGHYVDMVTDRVTHYESDGSIINEWYVKNHTNFEWYYNILEKLNDSEIFLFRGELDPVHANAIHWDPSTNHVWMNSRHFNQVYEFDMTTGELVYIYGNYGNFTMYDQEGNEKDSLWFNSHDWKRISHDPQQNVSEFTLFDNGHENYTDINDDFATNGSDLVRVKVDYDEMTMTEVFRYSSEKQYHSQIWGGTQLLDNGNYLGSYGSYFKGTNRSDPITKDFGGVALEVTPQGEVVWEMQTPFNWGFYRFERIIPTLELGDITVGDDALLWEDAFSNFPESYTISFTTDLSSEVTEDWDGGAISIDFDRFDSGNQTVEIEIFDASGNSISQQFTVDIPAQESDSDGVTDTDETPITSLFITLSSAFVLRYSLRKAIKK